MEEIVINELTHDGMRRLKVIGDSLLTLPSPSLERVIPHHARERVEVVTGRDELLDLYSLEMTWPVYEPYEIFCHGPRKFRRLVVVNYVYAERVSDCIELARTEFFERTHYVPGYAFVRDLPKGAEIGMDVHGCILQEAEWMPGQCAAVGGRDG